MIGIDAITFSPLVPWTVILSAGLGGLVLMGWLGATGLRGSWARLLVLGVLLLALAGPQFIRRDSEPLDDIVLLVADLSESQDLPDRAAQTADTLSGLQQTLAGLPGVGVEELRVTSDADGTQLFGPLKRRLSEIPRDRLSAVIVVSDGLIHDSAADLGPLTGDVPIHSLLSGDRSLRDRRLQINEAPEYALVDRPVDVTVTVMEDNAPQREPIRLVVRQDGRIIQTLQVQPGQPVSIPVVPSRRGPTVIQLDAEIADGETITRNNTAVVEINAVRDRLKVLLISGEPHPGERIWRDTLKSDPAVDLIHFTILRLPTSQDPTPANELSLIPFPTQRLFNDQLDDFDLVIFDRYTRRGVLDPGLLDNLARYAQTGGAILLAVGPEFSDPISLYNTALAPVLPAEPTGQVVERAFRPQVTDLGGRHPVTAPLFGADDSWGNWYRYIETRRRQGDELMTTPTGQPLLVLDHQGEGRVAQLMSDQVWMWARGVGGGGPYQELLRRIVHWLMKEPDLEEESLTARADGQTITVDRRSLDDPTGEVQITGPDGTVSRMTLSEAGPGAASGRFEAPETGLYEIDDGERRVLVAAGPTDSREFRELAPTDRYLAPVSETTGGASRWLSDGRPNLRRVLPGNATAGRDWIGLPERGRERTTALSQSPVLPNWAWAILLGCLLAGAWWREGR